MGSNKENHYNGYGRSTGYTLKDEDREEHYDDQGKSSGYSSKGNSGGCFLTTACVEHKGFSDNCYELETLRKFRDNYMMSFDEGTKDVKKYYEIAPIIINNIDELDNKNDIYEYIYKDLIIECIRLINNNEMNASYEKYKEFVKELYNKYCINK